jgi:hypothetical protein
VQVLWKIVWRFLKKLRIDLSYDSAIPLLSINPKECMLDAIESLAHPRLLQHYLIANFGNNSDALQLMN